MKTLWVAKKASQEPSIPVPVERGVSVLQTLIIG